MRKNLLSDSLVYGTAGAFQKLAPLVIIPLIANYMGKEALKNYDVAFGYASVFSWLIILGQDAAASLLFFDEKTAFNKKQVLAYAFVLQIASLVLLFGLLYIFSGWFGTLLFANDAVLARWWQVALLVLPGQITLNYALNLLLWQRRKTAYTILCFVQTALTIGAVGVCVFLLKGNLSFLFYAVIGSVTVTGLTGLVMVRKQLTTPLLPVNGKLLKRLLLLGLPFALTAFFQQALPAADRFFLLRYNYGPQLAVYVLAAKLGTLVNFAASAFILAFTPYSLSKLNEQDAEAEIGRVFRFVSVAAFLLLPILLLFKDVLVTIFANASYSEAAKLLPFFFFGWVFDLFYVFTVLGIYRSHKTQLSLFLFLIGFALISLLNVLLVPILGLYGAAVSFCLCKAGLFFLSWAWLKKHFHLRLHPASFWPALLLSVAGCWAVYLLPLPVCIAMAALLAVAGIMYFKKKNIRFR